MVSRTISPYSAAELINVTYEINRRRKKGALWVTGEQWKPEAESLRT